MYLEHVTVLSGTVFGYVDFKCVLRNNGFCIPILNFKFKRN